MDKKVCASCQHENAPANFFCTRCGSKLIGGNQNFPQLSIVHGEPEGAQFLLRKGRNTIGHDCANLIVLGDNLISNKHAVVTYDDDVYWIEDRNSKNGVYLNGEKISNKERLTNGSVIKLGTTILKFESRTKK